jgi:hypothetical protein
MKKTLVLTLERMMIASMAVAAAALFLLACWQASAEV